MVGEECIWNEEEDIGYTYMNNMNNLSVGTEGFIPFSTYCFQTKGVNLMC